MPRFPHSSFVFRHSALAAVLFLSGCQALYFLQGKGTQPALYELPKDQRVLVFIDSPPAVQLPANYAATLGDQISNHLFKNNAATKLVTQDRLSAMRSDPTFATLGVADVAKATSADVVLYVNLISFNTALVSGGAVSQGNAQALVKVIDKNGQRLWPLNQPAGYPVEAHVDENLSDNRDQPATEKEISNLLTTRIGRLFHKYSLDDADMIK
ncbi:MAG: hypothetical protein ACTHN5_07020 [Phycisphaerae bacterium]